MTPRREGGSGHHPAGLHVVRQEGDGNAPAVVVVHGGMDRSTSFGRVAKRLPEVPLVRYDRRGYGRSRDVGAAPLEVHVDDLLGIVGTGPVAVFGHSAGGVIALLAALRRPDAIRAVLAYEAPTPWAAWWSARPGAASGEGAAEEADPADEAERFMRRMVGDRVWERLPPRTRADRRAEGSALRADLDGLAALGRPDLASLTIPMLSAAGADSTDRHRRSAAELAEALPAGELVEVPGATHGIHLTHPAEAAALVRRVRALATG